jgi:hypothetical protein
LRSDTSRLFRALEAPSSRPLPVPGLDQVIE